MKKFLQRLLNFTGVILVVFCANALINKIIISKQSLPLNQSKVLIMGDSHPQRSLNPKFFSNAVNISQPAEPYIITFWKLKTILKSIRPDTIIIGFAPHNISAYNDLKFSQPKWASEMFRRSYLIEEFNLISNEIEVDYYTFYKTYMIQMGMYPKLNHINFIGSYKNNRESDVTDWEESIKRHYYFDGKQLGVSEVAVSHLDSMISLCKRNEITVVLASHPVHQYYLENIPNSTLQRFTELSNYLSKKAIVFDKTSDYYPDSLYFNPDHLNEIGSEVFTKELISQLR